MNQAVWNAVIQSLKPHGNIDLVEWLKTNAHVTNSARANTIDMGLTPWFREIYLDTVTNQNLNEICVCAPTGAGKSTTMLAIINTCVGLYPKQILVVQQSEQFSFDFLSDTVKPSLKKNANIRALWPQRNNDRRDALIFPSMAIYTGHSTSIKTLQSKSIDIVLGDECWLWETGAMQEARKRLHDRPASKCLFVSQGSFMGDDFANAFHDGKIKKYAWKCDTCEHHNIYSFDDLKFDYEKSKVGKPIWKTVNAYMECPHCNTQYKDEIDVRRRLSENAVYVVENEEQNHVPNKVSYTFNKLCIYPVSWTSVAIEFLKANDSLNRKRELAQFFQKTMAEFWDEAANNENINLDVADGGYAIDEFKFERWDSRFMTVDVQANRMYVGIRDWNKQGGSRLVTFFYASTFADIERARIDYQIKPTEVFVDCAYRDQEVKNACATYSYIGLNGIKDQLFKVKDRKGNPIERLFSTPTITEIKTHAGIRKCQTVNYAGTSTKDLLFTLVNSPSVLWQIPSSGATMKDYQNQLNAEIREIGKTGKPFYRKLRDDNHALDLETMQIIAALIWGCLTYTPLESEVEEISESN